MKLSDGIVNAKKVLEHEAKDYEVEAIIIKEDSFHLQINGKFYEVENYPEIVAK